MHTIWSGGGIPTGYIYNSKKKVLEFDPFFRQTVQLIFGLAIAGNSALEIATELNNRKIKSRRGGDWSYKTISYFFNPDKIMFYAGYLKNKQGNWPAYLTIASAEKLIGKKVVTTTAPRPHQNTFLLPGLNIAFCGHCSGKLKSSTTKRAKSVTHYYLCSNKQMRGASYCPESKVASQDKINDMVFNSLRSQKRNIKNIIKYTNDFIKNHQSKSAKTLQALTKEINKILLKQSRTNNAPDLSKINSELQALIEKRSQIITEQIINFDFNDLKNIELDKIERLSLSKQQEILKKFIAKISLYKNKLQIEYPFIVNAKGSKIISLEH